MKRSLLVLTVLLISLAAIAYLRPLAVLQTATRVWLNVHGFRSDFVNVDGHRVHYMIGGGGPPLILIHGLASRGEDLAPIMTSLEQQHTLYVPDLLGFGESDRPNIEYSVAEETEMIRGFLDAKHIARCDVLAASMGGWIALKLAAEHPERVRRLVLVDSAGFRFPTTMTENTFTPRDEKELLAVIQLQTDRVTSIPRFIARDVLRKNHEHAWILRRALHSMLEGRDLMDGRVQRVTMPVLLAWGVKDRIVPLAIGEKMQRELPNARLVAYSDCGHLAVIECRQRLLPDVERFLGVN